jgi:hypothetical protein
METERCCQRRSLVPAISAVERSPRGPSSSNQCKLHGWRHVALGRPVSGKLAVPVAGLSFCFAGLSAWLACPARGVAGHQFLPSDEFQMQMLSLASCRLHLPLLPRALAVQAAASSLGHPRPNPSVKGTSRKRAAPYVER